MGGGGYRHPAQQIQPQEDRDMANDAVYAAITDQLLAEMDKGVAPWRREWTISGGERHRNAISWSVIAAYNRFWTW